MNSARLLECTICHGAFREEDTLPTCSSRIHVQCNTCFGERIDAGSPMNCRGCAASTASVFARAVVPSRGTLPPPQMISFGEPVIVTGANATSAFAQAVINEAYLPPDVQSALMKEQNIFEFGKTLETIPENQSLPSDEALLRLSPGTYQFGHYTVVVRAGGFFRTIRY